jgi:hypothetical protein
MTAALAIARDGAVVYAASGALRVDPATQTVGAGQQFEVTIIQDADVATTGAQTTLFFDPSILRVVDVRPGDDYASAQFLYGIAGQDLATVIAEANNDGTLFNFATFILPGSGSAVAPGPTPFIIVTMEAIGSGTSPLNLYEECVPNSLGLCETQGNTEMIDEFGSKIPVSLTNGSVTVSGTAPPPPPPGETTPTPSPEATNTARPEGTGVSTVLAAGSVVARVNPGEQSVAVATEFETAITIDSGTPLRQAQIDLTFDPDVVEILSIAPGDDWAEATGANEEALAEVVSTGNETGTISAVFLLGPSDDPAPDGETTILTISMRSGDSDGETDLVLARAELLDEDGNELTATLEDGRIVVGEGSGGGGMNWLWVGLASVVGIGAIGGGAAYYIRRRNAF